MDRLLTSREVARIGIAVRTVYYYNRLGILKPVRLPTGAIRYRKSDLEKLLKQLKSR